jgi:hypothetical protein
LMVIGRRLDTSRRRPLPSLAGSEGDDIVVQVFSTKMGLLYCDC